MKLAIVGTRHPSISYEEFKALLEPHVTRLKPTTICSGGAKGIDTYARQFATERSLELIEHRPDYKRYGRAAPLVRNTLIVRDCDHLIAFVSKESRGTYDTIRKCNKPKNVIHI